ncbi:MAG: efflux transporter outer membrane subunit [Methylomonas lenta]|nr:efflux transporter outer membrane subunit [Methylomonas lenta]
MAIVVRYRVLIFSVAILSFVSGCAWFGDETQRAEMMPVPAMSQTLADAKFSSTNAAWPQANWWQSFNIPALNQLIETALAGNPDFKATAARLRQSQAMVDAQAAELYPTVDANVSFSAQRFSANSTQAKFAGENFRQLLINPLVLRYHLDFWGRDQAALEAAVGRSLAVDAEMADAKLLLATAVAASYFDLVTASEKLLIAENISADSESLLNLHQVRLTTGLVTEAPVLQARIVLHGAQQQVAGLRAEVELQKNLLAALAGQGPDWGRNILVEKGVLPKALRLPADLSLRLLAHRPDVTAARLQAQAAAQEIKVAETGFYPDVNLLAFTGFHSVSLTDVLLQGSSLAYAVGPSIEFPIFEGGRLRANLSYQEATYDAAVERYNASLLHAVQDVADALARWREIDRRMVAQSQSVADVVDAKDLAVSLNRNGLNDRTDLMLADLEAHQQRLQLTALQGQHFKVAVQVIKALGGGFNDIKNDNQKLSYAH